MKKVMAILLLIPVLWGCSVRRSDEFEASSRETLPAEVSASQ